MKKGLFNRRIPTLFALVVLLVVIAISTYLIQRGIIYIGKAAPDTQPQNFSLSNITDSSFTAVFTTSGQVDSVLNVSGAQTGNTVILDDRDKKTGSQNKYFSHHITVPNLSPHTTYVFKLIVGGKEYTASSYAVKTGETIASPPPAQNPLFGKILLPDGSVGSDAIVVSKTNQSEVSSAVTDVKGEFILPANSLRNEQSNSYVTLSGETVFTITVFRQNMKATVKSSYSVAQNLPPITLLQQYVFSPNTEIVSTQSSQLDVSVQSNNGNTVDITSPKQGEFFVDMRPAFTGTSYPNSSITLLIPGVSEQQLLTKPDGSWSYQTPGDIPQGKHTLTITTNDLNNKKVSITRTFTIFPQGSQVAESATPSASPTIKPTATATPTPTPTSTPIPTSASTTPSTTPQQSPSPTPTPTTLTVTPTQLPTIQPTVYFTPTKLPPITKPGSTENTIALTGISIFLIVAGTALLFAL